MPCSNTELGSVALSSNSYFGFTYDDHINLDDPDSLELVSLHYPGHYQALKQILNEAALSKVTNLAIFLKTGYWVKDLYVSNGLLKTSYPPKKLASFTLDKTRYSRTITDWTYSARVFYLE